jgi:hypothetical protein
MRTAIIQSSMWIRRTGLRLPALLSVLLLLLTGVREAYAFGRCPMMHPGAESAEVVAPEASESDHAHHHPVAAGEVAEPQQGVASAHSEHGEDGCQCRIMCVAVSAPTPPQPVTISIPSLPPVAEGLSLPTGNVGFLPTLNLPHILPFANAPPSHS